MLFGPTSVKEPGKLSLAAAATIIFSNLCTRDFAGGHQLLKASLRELLLN
jgi:hypothetical protein